MIEDFCNFVVGCHTWELSCSSEW